MSVQEQVSPPQHLPARCSTGPSSSSRPSTRKPPSALARRTARGRAGFARGRGQRLLGRRDQPRGAQPRRHRARPALQPRRRRRRANRFSVRLRTGLPACDSHRRRRPAPPAEIGKLAAVMAAGQADLVIGSRFAGTRSYMPTGFRFCGIKALALGLSLICRQRVTDPTSASGCSTAACSIASPTAIPPTTPSRKPWRCSAARATATPRCR